MDEPVETELKLDFDPADRDALESCGLFGTSPSVPRRLAATYFDTNTLQLDKAGYTLRIRKEGDKRVQTVKAASNEAAGLFVRDEWECRVTTDKPVFDERAGPLAQFFEADLLASVEPMFTTAIDRTEGLIDHPDGSRIEYAIDLGEVRAGTRSSAVNELELELKQGDLRALFDLARKVNDIVPLRLGVLSKSDRGYALADRAFTAAAKAAPVKLDKTMNAGDAFAVIAAACLRQYRLNENLLLLSGGSEPLHQARVALRRLRSAFWLFAPLIEDDSRATAFVAELRWLAGALGEIREVDVLIAEVEEDTRPRLCAVRESRFAHLRTLLDGNRVRMLPIEMAEWLASGAWRSRPVTSDSPESDLRSFAASRLDKLRKRMKHKGKRLANIGDDHRHEIRKDAKKLRYASEFFVSLYPGRKPRRRMERFLDRLEALQDKLGRLNDIAHAPGLFARLGVEIAPPLPDKKERKRLLEDAEDCFETFIDSKRFWRD